MRTFIYSILSFTLFAMSAGAASFTTEKELSNGAVESFAETAYQIQKDLKLDRCSGVKRYSFTRSKDEENLNTIKQLNMAKAGLNSDDKANIGEVEEKTSVGSTIVDLLENLQGSDDEDFKARVAEAKTELVAALRVVRTKAAKGKLSVFSANHADEDGSWKILNILDEKNKEVLLVQFGGCGT